MDKVAHLTKELKKLALSRGVIGEKVKEFAQKYISAVKGEGARISKPFSTTVSKGQKIKGRAQQAAAIGAPIAAVGYAAKKDKK